MRGLLVAMLLAACDGSNQQSGASEPIIVHGGVFHPGELPVGGEGSSPVVVLAASIGGIGTQGQAGISFDGLASPDAYSVAVRFPTVGTGYWVVPVQGPDVTADNNLVFSFDLDLTPEVPIGIQDIWLVAIGEDGAPGPLYISSLCVLPEGAHNSLAACDPSITPPNAVISLTWDTDVDLDLVVIAPNGKIVSSKTPTTVLSDVQIPFEDLHDPSTGRLTRDSNADCVIDAIRLESLIFPGEPPAGEYKLFASLHQHCGQPSTRFNLTLLRRIDAEDGSHPVERTHLASGALLAVQADGGATLGTHVTTITLP